MRGKGKGEKEKREIIVTNYQLPITNYQLPITHYPIDDIPAVLDNTAVVYWVNSW